MSFVPTCQLYFNAKCNINIARAMFIVFILNRQGTLSYLYQSSYGNYIFTLTMLINITTKYTFYLLLDVASMSQQHKIKPHL